MISRYQKKIGCYDEQVWEKRIEHKKYYRFSPVDLKSTNLKPGLIDLDLVKGIATHFCTFKFTPKIFQGHHSQKQSPSMVF